MVRAQASDWWLGSGSTTAPLRSLQVAPNKSVHATSAHLVLALGFLLGALEAPVGRGAPLVRWGLTGSWEAVMPKRGEGGHGGTKGSQFAHPVRAQALSNQVWTFPGRQTVRS